MNQTYWDWLSFCPSSSSSGLTTASICHIPWSARGHLYKVTSSRAFSWSCVQTQVGLSHSTLSLRGAVRLYLSHIGYVHILSVLLAYIYRPLLYISIVIHNTTCLLNNTKYWLANILIKIMERIYKWLRILSKVLKCWIQKRKTIQWISYNLRELLNFDHSHR